MAETRIYAVETTLADGELRLVEAVSAAQAVRHCVQGIYRVKAATPKLLAHAMSAGARVERVSSLCTQKLDTNEGA